MGQRESQEKMLVKSMLNAEIEKKDPKAWAKVKAIGKAISKSWKIKTPSWQIISTSRR
ncbi:MAG: hypothetical protein ACYCO0_04870 [Candidatus Micrarchaeaceae archaeon]